MEIAKGNFRETHRAVEKCNRNDVELEAQRKGYYVTGLKGNVELQAAELAET
jgi:hypothetical protein